MTIFISKVPTFKNHFSYSAANYLISYDSEVTIRKKYNATTNFVVLYFLVIYTFIRRGNITIKISMLNENTTVICNLSGRISFILGEVIYNCISFILGEVTYNYSALR